MARTYNPYSAINAIYNYKSEWDSANKSGDITKRDKAAENAKAFYKQLRDNGYGATADQLSSVDVSGAKYILDQYSAKNTGVDNQAYNTSMQSATNKNNTLAWYIDSDRKDVQGKYNDIYNYANQDITQTDEYKSAFKNIMPEYNLKAMQGRDNAVASGSASNGGNVDSYAAANAMRQQSAITAKGQALAHQIGLESANARIANVFNILNNLGVYNSGTYDAMNQTIANDSAIGQQYFDNSETAKNNEVARLSEQASVTGYTPKQWQYSNNPYFNSDGTLNEVYMSEDFDNTGGFTTIINNAKAKLAKTTDETERANLQATINYATQAKAYKTLNNAKYAPYAHEVEGVSATPTLARDEMNTNAAVARETLKTEADTSKYAVDAEVASNKYSTDANAAMNKYNTDASVSMNAANNAATERQLLLQLQASVEQGNSQDIYTNLCKLFASDEKLGVFAYIRDVLPEYITDGKSLDASSLAGLMAREAKTYGITKEDAKIIGYSFGINDFTDILDKYEWSADGKYDNEVVKGTESFDFLK